jgi:hypothetical protein
VLRVDHWASVGSCVCILACGSADAVSPRGEETFTAEITGAFEATMSGAAFFEPPGTNDLLIQMDPRAGNLQQRLYLFIRGGLPRPGQYAVGHYTTSSPSYARMPRDTPGGGTVWESTDGTVTISAASPGGVIGTVAFTASYGADPTIYVVANFSAAPRR